MSDNPFCVPSPCSLVGNPIGCACEWCFERCQTVNINQVYTFSYLASYYLPILLSGIPTEIGNDLSSWLLYRSLIESIPYVATLIVLFIVLMATKVISIWIGILLIILLISLVVICLAWAAVDAVNFAKSTTTTARSIFDQNWQQNKDVIEDQVRIAINNPDDLACTGFIGLTGLGCFPIPCLSTCPRGPTTNTFNELLTDPQLLEQYRQDGEQYLRQIIARPS